MTKTRSRWAWVWEDDQSLVLMLAPVIRDDGLHLTVLLALGPWRAGVAWRRAA